MQGMLALGIELSIHVVLLLACALNWQQSAARYKPVDIAAGWVKVYATFAVLISAVFWLWAVVHVAEGSPDLGVLSFAATGAAGFCGLRLQRVLSPSSVKLYR